MSSKTPRLTKGVVGGGRGKERREAGKEGGRRLRMFCFSRRMPLATPDRLCSPLTTRTTRATSTRLTAIMRSLATWTLRRKRRERELCAPPLEGVFLGKCMCASGKSMHASVFFFSVPVVLDLFGSCEVCDQAAPLLASSFSFSRRRYIRVLQLFECLGFAAAVGHARARLSRASSDLQTRCAERRRLWES